MEKFLLAVCFVFLLFSNCSDKGNAYNGLTPEQSLAVFQLPDGFKIELVASEPMISDPVAMEVDENGNIYVLEMHGYPLDTSGTGKIKLLTDTDGDGAPDKSTLFADHLRLPTGIMRWKQGLIVIDVPDILYLEDSTNDGEADIKKTLITGIALTNPQHIANTPIFGLDNWIYLAHMGTITPKVSMEFSDIGSNVRYVNSPGAKTLPPNADGRNIRFKPDTYELEMLSGETQYGHTFDNWGHHFCVENADHIFHEAIAAKYLQRNPHLPVADASDYISDHGDACVVYPITLNPENQLLTDRGVITSACGITWYNGGLFPDSFNNVTFVAEPTSNMIHADRVIDHGAGFTASRVYEQREFLASKDGWSRPVQLYIGPDGGLYVMDYYRQIIEHPEWLSDSVINSGALYNGHDKGRIYRITPTSAARMNWCNNISLGKASTEELVQALNSNNIWWRRNAQRLLLNKKDDAAIDMLRRLADTSNSPTAIVHALWTLEGLQAIDEVRLINALHQKEAGVRENAIQIVELHLGEFPGLGKELFLLENDPSAKVRFQLLCTLGNIHDTASETARQNILVKNIEDKWIQVAALSSSAGKELALLQKCIPVFSVEPSEGKALFFSNCAGVIGRSQKIQDIQKLIRIAVNNNAPKSDWWQAACLSGLTNALSAKGFPPENMAAERSLLLSKFSATATPQVRKASVDLLALTGIPDEWSSTFTKAKNVAADKNENTAYRSDALKLLALDKNGSYNLLLETLIADEENPNLQQAALYTYNKLSPAAACNYIIASWNNFSTDMHGSAMDVFLSSGNNMRLLLDAVKNDIIQTASISWPQKVQLMSDDNEDVRKLARQLLAPEMLNREKIYKQYEPVVDMKGDAAKGLTVFKTVCGTCHQYAGQYGKTFGPDLGSIRNRDKTSIMADVLNPNRSIAVKYDLWYITQKNGEQLSGIIHSETSNAITVNLLGGRQVIISRADINNLETAETSAMPEGLETSISKQEMADLLAFLTGRE